MRGSFYVPPTESMASPRTPTSFSTSLASPTGFASTSSFSFSSSSSSSSSSSPSTTLPSSTATAAASTTVALPSSAARIASSKSFFSIFQQILPQSHESSRKTKDSRGQDRVTDQAASSARMDRKNSHNLNSPHSSSILAQARKITETGN
eukprot:TRINITY_DN6056_c0_g2_i1.p2 TRINITY_DN6056_c0_g2~~TRINITY_DN6056_c0_g2_i1.p2  ORF type:complete len:150 (-),score=21.59 TRINITY_DN6056_c0_g2_i1:24-473(-)